MQAMSDGLTVLGSRHGFLWDPFNRRCYLERFHSHPGLPCRLRVGIRLANRTAILPLAPEGEVFGFVDGETMPTSIVMTGVDPETALKVRLQVRIPFRPQDADFSTVPVLYFTVHLSRLDKSFRWQRPVAGPVEGEVFIELGEEKLQLAPRDGGVDISFDAPFADPCATEGLDQRSAPVHFVRVQERLQILAGQPTASGAAAPFRLEMGQSGPTLRAAWCAYAPPILRVHGEACPFRYVRNFGSLEEVVSWAISHADEVEKAGRWFDALIADNTLGTSVTHLMAQTLHAWLANTWWVRRPSSGQDWFSVWEGSCHFHSTVDVEFTQTPFYMTLWPELLRMQLDEWPAFAKPGELCLGERGAGTLFLAHDMGALAGCGRQIYPHDMEVEEVTNYILMAYAYWRRSGSSVIQQRHSETIRRFLDFIIACDTTGNGVPDRGCTNTIDDASPAIQYGREQVYLAVKALGALLCGADLLVDVGEEVERYRRQAERLRRTLAEKAWREDHFVVTLDPSAEGLFDPWTGKPLHGDLPGWDASHIYTTNGLAVLDMVGKELGLDDVRLAQDAIVAGQRTLTQYGCQHTDHVAKAETALTEAGIAIISSTTGWVSMNMIRDIAAAYRGVDMLSMADRYWDWQAATNSREVTLFFETFRGNNLCFYPRGVAVWGYFEAAARLRYDRVTGRLSVAPLRRSLRVPLLALANWQLASVPVLNEDWQNQKCFF